MSSPARLILAAALLAVLAGTARAQVAGLLEVRTDDRVYLVDSDAPLVGEIEYQNERELKIRIGDQRIARIVPMTNVRRVLRRQNAQEAFDRRFKEFAGAKNAGGLYDLAVAARAMAAGNPDMVNNAIKALDEAVKLRESHMGSRLLLGQLYLQVGEVERARREADRAVALEGTSASAQFLLAAVQAAQGDFANAEQTAEKVLNSKPSAEDRIGAARVFAEIGRLDRAGAILEEVAKQEPRNVRAKLAAGLVWLRQCNLDQATPLLEEAAAKLRDQIEPHQALAALYYLKGDQAAALKEVNQALNYGGRSECYALKALIELRAGKPAAASADAAFRVDPNGSRTAATKAAVELAAGNLTGAADALKGPLDKPAPGCRDAYVHYLHGHILCAQGKWAEAHAAFARAAEMESGGRTGTWAEAYLAAGAAALKARKFQDAARSYIAAARILDAARGPGPADKTDRVGGQAHAGLGLAYLGMVGRDEDADRELRRALALDSSSLEAHLGLGYLANRLKREAEAINYFERAAAISGGNSYAAEALGLLRAGRGETVDFYSFDGPDIPAGWRAMQNYGVLAEIRNGRVVLSGKQKVAERDTRLVMQLDSRRLARLEMDVEAEPKGGLAAGIFVASTRGFLEVGLAANGKAAWRMKNMGGFSAPEDLADWPKGPGGPRMRLAIEVLDAGQGRFRLHVNGRPVKDVAVDTLANVQGYETGAFCRAQAGDDVSVALDNATLVTKKGDGGGK